MIRMLAGAVLLLAPCVARPQDDAEIKKAIEDFEKAMKSQSGLDRAKAVEDLGKHRHDRVLAKLSPLLASDTNDVRIAAAKALGAFDSAKAVEAVANAVAPNLDHKDVLDALLKALEQLDYESAASVLNAFLDKHGDKTVAPHLPSIVATLGKLGSSSSVEPLITLLGAVGNQGGGGATMRGGRPTTGRNNGNKGNSLAGAVEKALKEITGGSETTAAKWKDWWTKNGPNLIAARTVVYRCKATGKRWEQKASDPQKCPNHDKPETDGQAVKSKLH